MNVAVAGRERAGGERSTTCRPRVGSVPAGERSTTLPAAGRERAGGEPE